MSRFKIVIVGHLEAEDQDDAERILVKELLPWENIDTANFVMDQATAEPA